MTVLQKNFHRLTRKAVYQFKLHKFLSFNQHASQNLGWTVLFHRKWCLLFSQGVYNIELTRITTFVPLVCVRGRARCQYFCRPIPKTILTLLSSYLLVRLAVRSTLQGCSRSIVGTEGSNAAGGLAVCLLCLCYAGTGLCDGPITRSGECAECVS